MPFLIREVSEELQVSQKDIREVITTFFDIIAEELAEGNTVKIMPYLKFTYRITPAVKKGTMVRNPFSGEVRPSPGRPARIAVRATTLSGLKKSAPGVTTKAGKDILAIKTAPAKISAKA